MTPFVSAMFLEHISNLQIRLRFCGHDLEKNKKPRFGQGNKQRVHSTGLVGQHGRHATGLTFHLNDPMLFQNLVFRDASRSLPKLSCSCFHQIIHKKQSWVTICSVGCWMTTTEINQNQCVITLNYPVPLSMVRQSSISSIPSLPPISSPPTYEVYHHIPRYAVYHRKDGLKKIAARVHGLAQLFAKEAQAAGLTLASTTAFFDTVLGQEKWGRGGMRWRCQVAMFRWKETDDKDTKTI